MKKTVERERKVAATKKKAIGSARRGSVTARKGKVSPRKEVATKRGRAASAKATPTLASKSTKRDVATELPEDEEVAELCGFQLTKLASKAELRGLRKGPPGHVGVLGQVAEQLEIDEALLAITGCKAAEARELHAKLDRFRDIEGLLFGVYRSARDQRLFLEDRAMQIMRKINNTVVRSGRIDLIDGWEFLREYLGYFAGGRPPQSAKATKGKKKRRPKRRIRRKL